MEQEVWKQIENFENYEISSYGRVRKHYKNKKVKYLKPMKTNGYLCVELWKNRKRKRIKIHRLVAIAFIPNTDNLPQVNHKDLNKENNNVENLEWISNRDNCLHYHKNKNKKNKLHNIADNLYER